MKGRIITLLGLFSLFVLSCRERNNIYDIGNDNFLLPPYLDAWPAVAYYDPQGRLEGIGFQIEFTEEARRNFAIHHHFYQDISLRTDFETTVVNGSRGYTVAIFGPYEVGPYSLRFNFGGMAIGACIFEVIARNNRLVIQNVFRYDTTPRYPGDWVHLIQE